MVWTSFCQRVDYKLIGPVRNPWFSGWISSNWYSSGAGPNQKIMDPNYGPTHRSGHVKLSGPMRSWMWVDFHPMNFPMQKEEVNTTYLWPKRLILGVHDFIARNAFYINFILGTSYKRLNGTSFRWVFKLTTKLHSLAESFDLIGWQLQTSIWKPFKFKSRFIATSSRQLHRSFLTVTLFKLLKMSNKNSYIQILFLDLILCILYW